MHYEHMQNARIHREAQLSIKFLLLSEQLRALGFQQSNIPRQTFNQYIWHTVGDDKVRSAHQANDGKTFSWNQKPNTGHPGEDYNCRCWAEPVPLRASAFNDGIQQIVISNALDGVRWGWKEFFQHYLNAQGKPVSLAEIGHLSAVIEHARQLIFPKVEEQVMRLAREVKNGELNDSFRRSYSFYGVSLMHGDSTVIGEIKGHVRQKNNRLIIGVTVNYHFSDSFTDPLNIREWDTGTSSLEGVSEDDLARSEFGTPYDVKGFWQTSIQAIIDMSPSERA